MEHSASKYSIYRDSGVDWIGQVPHDWNLLPIRAIFEERIEKNDGPKTDFILSVTKDRGVIPYDEKGQVGNNKSEDIERYKVVHPGDFVINKMNVVIGSLGMSKYYGAFSQVYLVYKPKSYHINIRFYSYVFANKSFYKSLIRYCTGIMELRESLSKMDFKKVNLPFPDLKTQSKVVEYLDDKTGKIDRAITQKEKMIELLKERKQIIIQNAVTKGLNPKVRMKDSGVEWIGEIPEHWEVKKLKHVLKSQGRIGFKGYSTTDLVDEGEGALTLGASHLSWDGRINISDPVYISWKKYYESPEIMVSKGDILIVQRGSTCGKVALVDSDLGPTTINPSLVLLKEVKEDSGYIFLMIKVVLDGLLNSVSSTAIPMLSQFQIDNISIVVPPKKEQYEIVERIKLAEEKMNQSIHQHDTQIEKLKEYKATLIDSAVTGKIKVS